VEALLPERLRDLEADIDPDEVRQLERPHAEAPAHPDDPVDLGMAGDALCQELQRLHPERTSAAIGEKAGAVARHDDALSEPLSGPPSQRDRIVGGLVPGDHLEQLHRRHRVEEVHSDDVLRPRRRARHPGDR
jgi:hypothetical protein